MTHTCIDAKTLLRVYVQRDEKFPEVIVDVEISGEDVPDEARTRIAAATEGFSEQVKRILDGEEMKHTADMTARQGATT